MCLSGDEARNVQDADLVCAMVVYTSEGSQFSEDASTCTEYGHCYWIVVTEIE